MEAVKFLSFSECTLPYLMPAPSVRDCEEISEAMAADQTPRLELNPDALLNKELKVIATYRGCLMYLEGGQMIHRIDPKTVGGNGYAGWPSKGITETVRIGGWRAEVEYV
jgi:hypothetical protein